MPRLQRILIANRGEIAVRIIHACHDTGRTAIAAYADPDADALFVHLADESYALHGADAKSTYLNIDAIIETAKKAHADAIHPGYGFLAENADFAEAVAAAGMAWIGPGADTIRMLGSKVEARRIAAEVGAPMAPGTTEPVRVHIRHARGRACVRQRGLLHRTFSGTSPSCGGAGAGRPNRQRCRSRHA